MNNIVLLNFKVYHRQGGRPRYDPIAAFRTEELAIEFAKKLRQQFPHADYRVTDSRTIVWQNGHNRVGLERMPS